MGGACRAAVPTIASRIAKVNQHTSYHSGKIDHLLKELREQPDRDTDAQAAHRGLGERLRKGAMPDGGCGFNCVSLLVKPGDATLAPMLPVRAVGVWLLVLVSGCRTPIQWDGV
jgi:hypothetical protein